MKKTSLSLVILALLLSGCTPTVIRNSPAIGQGTEKPPVEEAPAPSVNINPEAMVLSQRFDPPEGTQRELAPEGTFGEYLQHLPLKVHGAPILYYDGTEKGDRAYAAVIDQPISPKNLQQCADAIMRLKAEYHYARGEYDQIAFHFVSGFLCDFTTWSSGHSVRVDGQKVTWINQRANNEGYESFRRYMDMVHTYASTLSLEQELVPVSLSTIAVGDVFIEGGSPGHAIIVVDLAKDSSGETYVLLAESNMPAQETHILANLGNSTLSPWYQVKPGAFVTPYWTFPEEALRRFP